MIFTREQIQNAYKKLSPEIQHLVLSEETTELIEKLLKESSLSEDQLTLADSEILYALYGLQTLSEAITSMAKLSNKNIDSLSDLKLSLEETIFDEIYKIQKNTPPQPIDNGQSEEVIEAKIQKENSVGQSFEKIILNQAKAMQPAREQGWVPENLPAEKEERKPKVSTPNYTGQDPYRETLE